MIWEQVLGIAGALFLLICCFIPRDPTQCNFIGALVGGALGLIGASKQRKEQRRINEANRPVNQVREWEEAGINPLFGISSGGYVPYQAASIGDAYSVAGARFGQAIDQFREEKLAQTELKKENTALKEKLDELATPRIPSYLSQYGAIIPVPTVGGTNARQSGSNSAKQNTSNTGLVVPKGRVLDDARRGDKPYIPGTFLGPDAAEPVGSQRVEAEPPSKTLQPISWLGMTFRGTGTTSAAHIVEDNAGELASSAWGVPTIADYAVGTYSHNIGRPFADWLVGPGSGKKRPPKANTKTKAYRDFMKSAYPTAFD